MALLQNCLGEAGLGLLAEPDAVPEPQVRLRDLFVETNNLRAEAPADALQVLVHLAHEALPQVLHPQAHVHAAGQLGQPAQGLVAPHESPDGPAEALVRRESFDLGGQLGQALQLEQALAQQQQVLLAAGARRHVQAHLDVGPQLVQALAGAAREGERAAQLLAHVGHLPEALHEDRVVLHHVLVEHLADHLVPQRLLPCAVLEVMPPLSRGPRLPHPRG